MSSMDKKVFNVISLESGEPLDFEVNYYPHRQTSHKTPLLLAVHGFGQHTQMFEPFFQKIQSRKIFDCLTYNQRWHGPKFKNKDNVADIDLKLFSLDLCRICEAINDEFPDRNLYLCGNSMGGSVILYAGIKFKKRFESLNIFGVLFENPYIQIHPKQASFSLKMMVSILGTIVPKLQVPAEVNHESISHDKDFCDSLLKDPNYQYQLNFKSAKNLLTMTNYIYSNLHNWPTSVPYSLHISTEDKIVDPAASNHFFDSTGTYHDYNRVIFYEGAFHTLKSEAKEWSDKFFDNVCYQIS